MSNDIVCPVCESRAQYVFPGPHGAVAQCGSVQCEHLFSYEARQQDSLGDYSSHEFRTRYHKRNHLLIDYLFSVGILRPGQSVLDLGSGEGHIAACFKERGFDILCVEPSDHARELLDSRGLKNVPYASDIPDGSKFDFTYLVEVIEHIPMPTEALSHTAHFLAPSGSLLVTTPSAKSLRARLYKKHSNAFGIATHIHYFTLKSLTKCLIPAELPNVQSCYLPFMVPDRSVLSRAIAQLLYMAGLGGGRTER